MEAASTKSSINLNARALLIIFTASTLSLVMYLFASALTLRIGFPLDDSWIHLTYARNLALRGEWSFIPGVPSAGSTSPLWSALLAIGFFLRLGPYIWTFFLGGVTLFITASLAELAARRLLPTYSLKFPLIGIFFAMEWHLIWAAGSGMETLLHASILTLVLLLLTRQSPPSLTLGLLAALSVWIRPDGLTLLGPILLTLSLREKPLANLSRLLIGFGLLFGLYLLFNLTLSGNPFPNTFYAKQAEYAVWQEKPLLEKTALSLLQLLTGPSLFLLPGVVLWCVRSVRIRDWGTLAGMIWMAGYVLLYTLRLPPYQHGRYLIPVMPVLLLWGCLGVLEYFSKGGTGAGSRVMRLGWGGAIAMLAVSFWFLGARSYGQDVAYIETEMVAVAKWADANLPADALIAAHDIGALGYFDHHNLIDLAGLVSPEVIPFLRDETSIASYLQERDAGYLIAFPALYPTIAANSLIVYSSGGSFAPMQGGENLFIYQLPAR